MTLREQLRQVAIKHVNEHWFARAGAHKAATELAAMAFLEGWNRNSLDARVVLEFNRRMREFGAVTMEELGVDHRVNCTGCGSQDSEPCLCGCEKCHADHGAPCYCGIDR